MQGEQYLERPGDEREHGSFKREKRSLWPDQVETKNNKKKFKGFKQGIDDHAAFSDRLF